MGQDAKCSNFAALIHTQLAVEVQVRIGFIPDSVSQALGSSIVPFKSHAPAQAELKEYIPNKYLPSNAMTCRDLILCR